MGWRIAGPLSLLTGGSSAFRRPRTCVFSLFLLVRVERNGISMCTSVELYCQTGMGVLETSSAHTRVSRLCMFTNVSTLASHRPRASVPVARVRSSTRFLCFPFAFDSATLFQLLSNVCCCFISVNPTAGFMIPAIHPLLSNLLNLRATSTTALVKSVFRKERPTRLESVCLSMFFFSFLNSLSPKSLHSLLKN